MKLHSFSRYCFLSALQNSIKLCCLSVLLCMCNILTSSCICSFPLFVLIHHTNHSKKLKRTFKVSLLLFSLSCLYGFINSSQILTIIYCQTFSKNHHGSMCVLSRCKSSRTVYTFHLLHSQRCT